jgi:hypothetical protein
LERCFVDFIDLLSFVPDDVSEKGIGSLLKKSEVSKQIFTRILQLSERYLYEPTSPVCNEERLIPFMLFATQSTQLEDIEKTRPHFLLNRIQQNRVGAVANDFVYTPINGEKNNLHSMQAAYIILYFNDPDCEECQYLIRQLSASAVIHQGISQGKLKIITVCVSEDREAWEKHASDIPDSWIYSYDAEQKIETEGIYDIKTFPALYLLDKDKKVLLKNTAFEWLMNYLQKQ